MKNPGNKRKNVGRFASPALADKYPDHRRIGSSMTGLHLHAVEIVCELHELREILTSGWFVALSTRRADSEKPVKLTITTEIP